MRGTKLGACVVALVLAIGCGNADRNDSIEAMNEGIRNAEAGNFHTALKAFDQAVKVYPQNHYAWYQIGQVQGRNGKWDKAITAFESAVRIKPDDAMYHMRLGVSYYENKNVSQAGQHLEKAISLNADLFRAHYYLGRVHRDEDRPAQAAEAWTRAAKLNPFYGKPFVRLGELYLLWGKTSEAISVLSNTNLVKDAVELTDIHYYLGLAYEEQKNWDKAIESYSKAIKLRSDNLDAKFQRGLVYKIKGDKRKAVADLEEFVNSGGGSAFNKQEANKALAMIASE